MQQPQLSPVKQRPVSQAVQKVIGNGQHATNDEIQNAIQIIEELFLDDADPKMVKVAKGRVKHQAIRDYLGEVDGRYIARVKDALVLAACGTPWREVEKGGHAYTMLLLMGNLFPILHMARQKMEQMRSQSIAERALARLEGIADDEEGNAGARVKACEVLLRASHPAFGAKTLAKEGNTRTTINFNIAAILGPASQEGQDVAGMVADVVDGGVVSVKNGTKMSQIAND